MPTSTTAMTQLENPASPVIDDPNDEALARDDQEHASESTRSAPRGLLWDRIDGVIDETAGGSGDLAKGKGKKNDQGKSKSRGSSGGAKDDGNMCGKCARPDHDGQMSPQRQRPDEVPGRARDRESSVDVRGGYYRRQAQDRHVGHDCTDRRREPSPEPCRSRSPR